MVIELTPRATRPYREQVMVDADTRKWIDQKRGRGKQKVSRSTVIYSILQAAKQREQQAAA